MTYDEKSRIYAADDGKMLVRKSGGKVFGDRVQVGRGGSIDNYEERVFTEEERAAFWESIGMDDPKKPKGGAADAPRIGGQPDADAASASTTTEGGQA